MHKNTVEKSTKTQLKNLSIRKSLIALFAVIALSLSAVAQTATVFEVASQVPTGTVASLGGPVITNATSELRTPVGYVLNLAQGAIGQGPSQPTVVQPISSIISVIQSNGEAHVGAAINMHGKWGPSVSEQLNLFGFNHTNAWLHIGVEHVTAFTGNENVSAIGVGFSSYWDSAPAFLRFVLFKADHVELHAGVSEPWETYTHLTQNPDWKNTMFDVSVGRKF